MAPHPFGSVFTSLFVALSPLTILPIYFNMTEGMSEERAKPLARQAILTAALVAISVLLALALNLCLIWAMLHFAGNLRKWVSPSVARAFGKVMSLMLAGISVSILRKGLTT